MMSPVSKRQILSQTLRAVALSMTREDRNLMLVNQAGMIRLLRHVQSYGTSMVHRHPDLEGVAHFYLGRGEEQIMDELIRLNRIDEQEIFERLKMIPARYRAVARRAVCATFGAIGDSAKRLTPQPAFVRPPHHPACADKLAEAIRLYDHHVMQERLRTLRSPTFFGLRGLFP